MSAREDFPDPGNVILDLAATRQLLSYLIGHNHNTRSVQASRRAHVDHPINVLLDEYNGQVKAHQQLFDPTYIKVGSVVRNDLSEYCLKDGGKDHVETICVSTHPLVTVAMDGTSRFDNHTCVEFLITSRYATPEELAVAMQRLKE